MQEWRREKAKTLFNGTRRHKDTKDDDYDYDYDFLSFVLRLSFFVPIIFWSGFALEIKLKIMINSWFSAASQQMKQASLHSTCTKIVFRIIPE